VSRRSSSPPAPPSAVAIRPFRPQDLPRALEMERENFSHYPLSSRQLRYHAKNPNAVFLVAVRGGVVVGDVLGLIRRHPSGVSGRVYSLVVDAAHRGGGIGARLFRSLVQKLKAGGARRIYLEVAQENHAAIALYERSGFRRLNVIKNYYARGDHAIHMLYEPR
jgi:ribosomal-protein-alanine N-acetyltransferase